jgi:hypothetical protein
VMPDGSLRRLARICSRTDLRQRRDALVEAK